MTEKIDRLKYSKIMYLYLEELVLQSEGKPLMQGNARCREELVKKKDSVCFASDPRCAQKPGDPRNQTADDVSLWKLQ